MGLRVSDDEEQLGLDVTQHGERGYVFDEASAIPVATANISQVFRPGADAAGGERRSR